MKKMTNEEQNREVLGLLIEQIDKNGGVLRLDEPKTVALIRWCERLVNTNAEFQTVLSNLQNLISKEPK